MEERRFGRAPWRVPALGLGGAGIGNLYRQLTDEEAIAVVRRALDLGAVYIDTAPLYGNGESERHIGLGLRGHPRASHCTVATKIGYVPADFDFSLDATIRSVHASLERLGLARIPVVQVHEIRPETWDVVMAPGGALDALERMKGDGLIEQIGVTSSYLPDLLRAVESGRFDSMLIWRHVSLLDDSGLPIVRAAAERQMGVVVATAFAGGILASGSRAPNAKYFYHDATDEERTRVARLEEVCARWNVSLRAAALRFPLRYSGVSTVIAGADRSDQVVHNVSALAETIPDPFWSELLTARQRD